MSKPKVYVTRNLPPQYLAKLRETCDVSAYALDEPPVSRDVLLREIRDCEGVFTLLTEKVDAEFMDAAPKLKVVSQMAVGFDNIDTKEATRRKIPVGHTPGVLTETTADFAFTLLMAGARRVMEGVDYIRAGKWKTWIPFELTGQDIYGKTLGLIGMGRIGSAVAKRARGFDMRVIYYDVMPNVPPVEGATRVSLDELLAQSDYISVHTPLTPETRQIINARTLRQMKRTAVLINTSRGPTVDTMALAEALKEGVIAYAALDVTDPEPIGPEHPLMNLSNCLVVPHIASASVETRTAMAELTIENLLRGLRGERLKTCANPDVYA